MPITLLRLLPANFARACLAFLAAALGVFAQATDLRSTYDWQPVRIGGGGWVTGLVVHPTTPDLVVARTDVGGAYKWDAATSSWTQLVTTSRFPDDFLNASGGNPGIARTAAYQVESIALAPSDPSRLFLAVGSSTSNPGRLFRSTDGGESFVLTNLTAPMAGNADFRMASERIAIKPDDASVMLFGSRNTGLWRSTDGGMNWSALSSAQIPFGNSINGTPVGINSVIFDLAAPSRVYASVAGVGIYRSDDAGLTWSQIFSGGLWPHEIEISQGIVYAAGTSGFGIRRYDPVSHTWSTRHPAGTTSIQELAVDPANPNRLYSASSGFKQFYRSTDGGLTWTSLGTHSNSASARDNFQSPFGWKMTSTLREWLSMGTLAFDPQHPGTLWFAEGMGVWRSTNISDSNNAPIFHDISHGIEEMVATDAIALPGGKLVTAVWDRLGFIHTDLATAPAAQLGLSNKFVSGWALATSPAAPDFVAAIGTDHHNANGVMAGRSFDSGATWSNFGSITASGVNNPAELQYGELVASATNPDHLAWLPRNGAQILRYTTDGGVTWQDSPVVLDDWNAFFFGNRRRLAADGAIGGKFYLYQWTNGAVLASTDGGATFTDTGGRLSSYTHHSQLKGVPGHANHLWFAAGRDHATSTNHLRRSTDGGATWQSIPFFDQAWAFGYGKAATPGGYPTLFVYGRAASGAAWGVWRSSDVGTSWARVADYPLGLFDTVMTVTGDADVFGKVYVGFAGNSFAYGEPVGSANTPPTITPIAPQTMTMNGTTGPLAFIVGDAESEPATLSVTPYSANPDLVPLENIVLGGNGANRNVTVTPAAGQYGTTTITLTVNDGSRIAQTSFTITVQRAPIFTVHPQSQTGYLGASLTLTAVAGGLPLPSFQWRRDGVDMPGATASTFTKENLTTGDAGSYTVVATNSLGSATSQAAIIDIATSSPPTISAQPAPQTVDEGGTLTLSVVASGLPAPTYQWLRNGTPIPGATTATYTKTGVDANDAGIYTVMVSNPSGNLLSASAGVIVNTAPTIAITSPSVSTISLLNRANTLALLAIASSSQGSPSVSWSRVSGPGIVTFFPPGLNATRASFSADGTYVLRATATNGSLSSSAEITVLVGSPDITANLSLHWKMNETSGTSVATAVGSNTGTITGSLYSWSPGIRRNALAFTGAATSTYVQSAANVSSSNSTGFTVAAWVRPDSFPASGKRIMLAQNGSGPAHNGRPWISVGDNGVLIGQAGNDEFSGGTLSIGRWHHVALTAGGGMIRLYLDGVEVANLAQNPSLLNNRLRAGNGRGAPPENQFLGRMDDVRFYSRVLPAAEVHRISLLTAPSVDPGPAPTANLNGPSTLSGSVTSEANVTTAWSKVSGPGTVTFASPGSLSTTVGFNYPGAYVLRLSAADGISLVHADVSVTVTGTIPLTFAAAGTVTPPVLTHINNPIDQSLADFPANAATPLTAYTATNGNSITGTITRTNLQTGTLLSHSQTGTLLASAQTHDVTSGVIALNLDASTGTQGINDGTAFRGINDTGLITVTSNTSLSTAYQLRSFDNQTGNIVGSGNTNSIGVYGYDIALSAQTVGSRTGYLNLNQTTLSFDTPLLAVGFTQLQRDSNRTYIWTVNLVNLSNPADTPSVELGRITFNGLAPGAPTGGPASPNYRYDTYVGYRAPAGYAVTGIRWGGNTFGHIDGLTYIAIPPAHIDLDPPPPPTFNALFSAWATAANLPPAHGGLLDTPFGDGVPNLLRFALALPANGPLSATHLPAEIDQGQLLLTYTRRTGLPGVQIYAETSATLAPGSWTQTGVQETVLSTTDGVETVEASVPVTAADRRFLRIRVVINTP